MNQKKIEQKALAVSAAANLVIAGAGVWVYSVTQLQSLFVDCFFSVIALVSSIMAVVISKVSVRRTKCHPDGLYFLEPLYAILKSLLTLTLMVAAVANASGTAYQYFAHGVGEPMNIGPVLPYALCMVVLCIGLGLYNMHQNRKINGSSIILTAESKSNIIDGLQSFGIGIAIVLLDMVNIGGPLGFLHYTGDFFVTAALAIISLKEPREVLAASFAELSGGVTQDKAALGAVGKALDTHLGEAADQIRWDIFKTGMHFKVRVSFVGEVNEALLEKLRQMRGKIIAELKCSYDSVELVFVF